MPSLDWLYNETSTKALWFIRNAQIQDIPIISDQEPSLKILLQNTPGDKLRQRCDTLL